MPFSFWTCFLLFRLVREQVFDVFLLSFSFGKIDILDEDGISFHYQVEVLCLLFWPELPLEVI